ncbi:hypothetical protein [Candidatus Methylobacter oryzae]|uniref:Uncharacterized protein n=1 Tax=Candidatus Methylobacter oryzae TaxID=2497749 RepID=A0ABY3C9B7_9GAMM|nr:hypothetical protein [Candidatus Methylobacter oryzae]TRW93076.1 hypothetical protein EKO24_013250 [Candidatus Methylobacter oryzae]
MRQLFNTLKRNYLLMLPPALFFFLSFSLLKLTENLILREYGISMTSFAGAAIGALIIAKVVLVVDHLPFTTKFSGKPLLHNVIWKSGIYFAATFTFRYVEQMVSFLREYGDFTTANQHLLAGIVWPHFWLIQIWLVILLFIYCAVRELIRAIGTEEVMRLFLGAGRGDTR